MRIVSPIWELSVQCWTKALLDALGYLTGLVNDGGLLEVRVGDSELDVEGEEEQPEGMMVKVLFTVTVDAGSQENSSSARLRNRGRGLEPGDGILRGNEDSEVPAWRLCFCPEVGHGVVEGRSHDDGDLIVCSLALRVQAGELLHHLQVGRGELYRTKVPEQAHVVVQTRVVGVGFYRGLHFIEREGRPTTHSDDAIVDLVGV